MKNKVSKKRKSNDSRVTSHLKRNNINVKSTRLANKENRHFNKQRSKSRNKKKLDKTNSKMSTKKKCLKIKRPQTAKIKTNIESNMKLIRPKSAKPVKVKRRPSTVFSKFISNCISKRKIKAENDNEIWSCIQIQINERILVEL